ncbi:MAG: hypothetical protein KME30_19415 [Iphinoe sp. HA4291-MV1]|jgi:hypothetical protein|nr:hypothetical protein [Iphinoe sp. HA4291-MV1]
MTNGVSPLQKDTVGKGIAIGLSEAGTTVYVIGRSLNNSNSSDVLGSLTET